jgi:hypothetical protein
MLSAAELRFATRQHSDLPAWVSDLGRRQPLRIWTLADAKSVTLRLGSESVRVRVRERSSLFVGEISGFEPTAGVEFQGMRVGDLIVFNQAHIFAASP